MRNFMKLLVLISALSMSCEGPAGPEGPQGPSGSQGTTGATGATGADGTNGTNGTNGADGQDGQDGATGSANVIYSQWFQQNGTGWAAASFYTSYTTYTTTATAPSLTQDILDNGVVLVYAQWPQNDDNKLPKTPVLLPFYWNYSASQEEQLYSIARVGSIQLRLQQYSSTLYMVNQITQYRYVLIPGAQSGGRSETVDYNDYDAVMEFYGIPK